MSNDEKPEKKISTLPGAALFCCFAVGVIGTIKSLHGDPPQQPGLSLLAAAVAFSSIVLASFRK